MVAIRDWQFPVINCEVIDPPDGASNVRAIMVSNDLGRAVELFVHVPPELLADDAARHECLLAALRDWEERQYEARSWSIAPQEEAKDG